MRLNSPGLLIDTLARNFWTFLIAAAGVFPGVDPEQEGRVYYWSWRDSMVPAFVWMSLAFGCLSYVGGWRGAAVWFLSPAAACMFFELSPDAKYRAPRVWLSRWYVSALGVVLVWACYPAWARWGAVILWAVWSRRVSRLYVSPLAFNQQKLAENPNPDLYRAADVGVHYLENCQQWQAIEIFQDVLSRDPEHWKAKTYLQIMESSRDWIASGLVQLRFVCRRCGVDSVRFFKDGERFTAEDHVMFFLKRCPKCRMEGKSGTIGREET